jgi:DNA-directed RNA polymerase specialized sigma24 family protein
VVLHCSFDWTYAEIAEVSDMSVRSVRTHMDRGLAKLRKALEVSADE